jgi:hypothetical protein
MASLHRCCVHLLGLGYRDLNIAQDLGIGGLAAAKHAFRPRSLLRKYAIAT